MAGAAPERASAILVSHSAGMGGAESCLLEFLRFGDLSVLDPVVVVPEEGPLTQALDGLRIEWVKARLGWWLAERNTIPVFLTRMAICLLGVVQLVRLLRARRARVVYTNTAVVPVGALAAKLCGIPHVWHVREMLVEDPALRGPLPTEWIVNFIARMSERVLATSVAVADQFADSASSPGKVVVIHDGVRSRSKSLHEPVVDGSPALAVVGAISPTKGQTIAIEAVGLLREQYPGIRLHLVGTGKAHHIDRLYGLIADLQLSDHVVFHGHLDCPDGVVDQCDALLVPSVSEGYGRVAVEALHLGVPVIASRVGGLVDVLRHGGGELISPSSPMSLANAIAAFVDDCEYGENLRREAPIAAARFSLERSVEAVGGVLWEVI